MAEGPNYRLQIIRCKHNLMQQEAALYKQTLDKMEAIARIEQAIENEAAHRKAIDDLNTQITGLEETHGTFDAANVDQISSSILKENPNG